MVELREKQTGKFLKAKILEILAKYGMSIAQLFSVTCDNGANMIAAVKELRKEFDTMFNPENPDEEDEEFSTLYTLLAEFEGSVNLVRCAVHTLQLAVQDITKKHSEDIDKISSVAKNCKKVAYKPFFQKEQHPLPPLHGKTRWGGIFVMLQNIFERKEFYSDLGKKFDELDLTENWKFIEEFVNAFAPVYACTKAMQERHVGLSDFYLAWLDTTRKVRSVKNELATDLAAALNTRLKQLKENMPLKAALLLDPRFHFLDSTLFSAEERSEIKDFIKITYQRLAALKSESQSSSAEATPSTSAGKTVESDPLDEYLTEMYGGKSSGTKSSSLTIEEQLGLLDVEPRQPCSMDVWEFWSRRRESHPELYAVASLIYSVPSNQVSVERAFSALRLVLSDQRTMLNEDTLEDILLTKLNQSLFNEIKFQLPHVQDDMINVE